jgi:hypothetical protein
MTYRIKRTKLREDLIINGEIPPLIFALDKSETVQYFNDWDWSTEEFFATQPDELESEEFNLLLISNKGVFRGMSIDFE